MRTRSHSIVTREVSKERLFRLYENVVGSRRHRQETPGRNVESNSGS